MAELRLFVSSPQEEFSEERKAIDEHLRSDPLLRRYCEAFLFENLPATDRRPDAVYLSEVEKCDVYVGLFGQTYGSVGDDVSPTEREFDHATKLGKKRLLFVKVGESTPGHPRMEALIRRAGQEVVRAEFRDPESLRAALSEAMVGFLQDEGWLRVGRLDEGVCPGADLADLERASVEKFLRQAKKATREHLGSDAETQTVVRRLGLLDAGRLTNAAILLFGASPTRFLPSSDLRCVHFHGARPVPPLLANTLFDGSIMDLIEKAMEFVMSRLELRIGRRSGSGRAPHSYEIPKEVVLEAIVNAVAHRDYASEARTQVNVFRDRVEIYNPGRLLPPLTLSSLREAHSSAVRNREIVRALRRTRYMEEPGTGIQQMIEGCRKERLPEPKFELTSGFVVTLSRRRIEDSRKVQGRYQNLSDGSREWQGRMGQALGVLAKWPGGPVAGRALEPE